jgi:hypothetical protein
MFGLPLARRKGATAQAKSQEATFLQVGMPHALISRCCNYFALRCNIDGQFTTTVIT